MTDAVARLAALGLRLPEEEAAAYAALAAEMAEAAAVARVPLPISVEPAATFRLRPARDPDAMPGGEGVG